jgi:hypothetical protein
LLPAVAQITVEEYLSAPFQSAEIEGLLSQAEYMDGESFRSPLFREVEVRLRTDDLNLSPEDLRFRLGFLNPMEQKANRKLESSQKELLQIKYQYETNKLLAGRYQQLIKHYFYHTYDKLLKNEAEKLSLAYAQMEMTTANFKEWVETEERILKKEMKRQDIIASMQILEYGFQDILKSNETINWDGFAFISVSKMQELVLPDTSTIPARIELAMKLLEMDQLAYNLEKAESRSNIGYIQAEYDLEGKGDINRDLGFQLGLSIPLFNPDRPKLQREKLELIEQEYELIETQRESSFDEFKLKTLFKTHTLKYQQLNHRISQVEKLGEALTYEDIEDYLALESYYGTLQILKLEVYLNCLEVYIDFLAHHGKLAQAPFINYISEDLREF